MPDREALTAALGNGWTLTAAGIRRRQNGMAEADLILSNGSPVFMDRCIVGNHIDRQDWALRATDSDRPDADLIQAKLLEMLPEILAQIQDQPRESQADGLVKLVTEMMTDLADDVLKQVDLWHDATGEPWATIAVEGHSEHWPLGSKRFKRWLARRYFDKVGKAPNSQSLTDAINVLAGKALFEGSEHRVHTRLAEHDGRIYLDLADEAWRAVEVDSSGWRITDNPPVRFRRAAGMQGLPIPEAGGSVEDLFNHLNVLEEDRPLVIAWIIQAFRPRGPYPVLPLYGEQGSGKTTQARVLRALVDPNVSPARSEPRDERDLMIAATNGWIVVTDNVSHLPTWLSDAYCRLATGGGLSTRQLYTDGDEIIFDAMRPQILTGIEEFVLRGDLLDRSIILILPRISPGQRKPERQFWQDFDRDRPRIIGALLDRVAIGLREFSTVELEELPRMADFALWAAAAAPGTERDQFLSRYRTNQETANTAMLDSSLVTTTLMEFIEREDSWVGTSSDLLKQLTALAGEDRVQRLRVWPKTPHAMRAALDRFRPALRRAGIELDFDLPRTGSSGSRVFEIRRETSEMSEQDGEPDISDDSDNSPQPSGNDKGGSGIRWNRNAFRSCQKCRGRDWWLPEDRAEDPLAVWHCATCEPPSSD